MAREASILDYGETSICNKSKDTLKIIALSEFIFEKYNVIQNFIKKFFFFLVRYIEDLKCFKKMLNQKILNNGKKYQS